MRISNGWRWRRVQRAAALILSGIIAVGALMLFATGCIAQPKPTLSGRISMTPEWRPMAYLVRPRTFTEIAGDFLGQVIDSARIDDDGRFSFHQLSVRPAGDLVQLTLMKAGSRFANQLYDADPATANYMPLVLTPGLSVWVTAEAQRFQGSLQVERPVAANRAMLDLRDIRIRAYADRLKDIEGLEADSLLLEKEVVERKYREALIRYADTTAVLYAALVAARWIAPDGDYERSAEFIIGQCRRWQDRDLAEPFVNQLCAAGDALPLVDGDVMPDLALPLVTGDTASLYGLLGKRLTLVDVWASWCAPCRRENREVLGPLHRQFGDRGFAIVAYALESSKDAWTSAIARDAATWTHASHLEGDGGPVMEQLRLRTIPANFLLDADGFVVAKNLHGEELLRFVEGWMQQ